MNIPERDLNVIRELSFAPNAEPMFEILKYCLIWTDEYPSDYLSAEGREFLADLWIVRGFIHRSLPRDQWGLDPKYFKDTWDFGLTNVPQWIGFERLVLLDSNKAVLNKGLTFDISDL